MDGLREYELKHARVAMCAVPALALGAAGSPSRCAGCWPADVQLVAFSAAAVLEAGATLPASGGLEQPRRPRAGPFPPLPPPPSPAVAAGSRSAGRVLAAAAWVAAGAAPPAA